MSLIQRIEEEYITAYKAKDTVRLGVLRFLKTAMQNYRVAKLQDADDAAVLDMIMKQSKQRIDSIEQYKNANRPELVAKEEAELVILQEYLPTQFSAEDLEKIIQDFITATGASTMQDMGKVMQALTAQHKGMYDGKMASDLVRKLLQ